jgi:sigma-54 dependent transcriptional regulator, acetoin dehydrogenase operon transcriptional activator AcoR
VVAPILDTLSEHEDRARHRSYAPHLDLLVECERPLAGPARYRLSEVDRVHVGRGDERGARFGAARALEILVPDGWMSQRHAELVHVAGAWSLADLDSKNGIWINGERVRGNERVPVHDGDLLQLGHTFLRLRAELVANGPAVLDAVDLATEPQALRTLSPAFSRIVDDARAISTARAPVLLFGESGTGKEVMARAIHELSGRRGDFVAVNCGAIPQELVESELFGHRKGAFSGATSDRLGFARQSDSGTLFLDEIGDLPLQAQTALLRTLQESQVTPVGSDRPVDVDLRIVSATHRHLGRMVRDGTFRHDLLARLDGVRLELPPLRDRREDIPLLVAGFLARLAPDRPDVTLAPDAVQAMLEYHWPLNIRELEHALGGALALARGLPITRADLPRAVVDSSGDAEPGPLSEADERQRTELVATLAQHKGNLAAVARALGKHRTQILRWMERYSLDANRFRG